MAARPLQVVGEPSYSATTAAQRATLSTAKSIAQIERTGCSSFSTPASRRAAHQAAGELIEAARKLRSAFAQ